MKALLFLIALFSFAENVLAAKPTETLACMAGASADIDGGKSYSSDATSIRFLMTLRKTDQKVSAVNIKHTGAMEGLPETSFPCSVNGAGNLYTCANGAEVVWYYPEKMHGVIANLGVVEIFKEQRANAAGIYNYSCTKF